MARAAHDARWQRSAKGKASRKKYLTSAKGKAMRSKYNRSKKGRASERKYAATSKGKANRERTNVKRRFGPMLSVKKRVLDADVLTLCGTLGIKPSDLEGEKKDGTDLS